jgi:hypothetical protein
MPSEQPTMPRDTYAKLLNHGANRHMALLAGEVATYADPITWPRTAIRVAVAVLLLAMGTGLLLSR